jgi:hypothetical protein
LSFNCCLLQTNETDAATQATTLNADYLAAGVDGEIVAFEFQVNNWATTTFPVPRIAEFEAADDEKKNNFGLFTALAMGPTHTGEEFVAAWEEEYAKIY